MSFFKFDVSVWLTYHYLVYMNIYSKNITLLYNTVTFTMNDYAELQSNEAMMTHCNTIQQSNKHPKQLHHNALYPISYCDDTLWSLLAASYKKSKIGNMAIRVN